MTFRWRAVALEEARPGGTVVVIDVLRAFTFEAWAFAHGAARVLAVADADAALRLARDVLPGSLAAGERGGRPLEGFDLGNSPVALDRHDVAGRTLVHRTSAGTPGLVRTAGSSLVIAASFVTAGATAQLLRARGVDDVTFVITGDSLGRDGDEDLACAELIAARAAGDDPDPARFTARVATSDAGRLFGPDGPEWAPEADLHRACEVDQFTVALVASTPEPALPDGGSRAAVGDVVEVRARTLGP